MKHKSTKCTQKMTKFTLIPYSDYYIKARDSIPFDHPHYDEVLGLLIDQVLDDYGYTQTNSGASTT